MEEEYDCSTWEDKKTAADFVCNINCFIPASMYIANGTFDKVREKRQCGYCVHWMGKLVKKV